MMGENQNAARAGVIALLGNDYNIEKYVLRGVNFYTPLPAHPFDLKPMVEPTFVCFPTVYRVGEGGTDLAIAGLSLRLKQYLAGLNHSTKGFALRIIRVQVETNWRDATKYIHNLYFEVASETSIYIAGDVNDYSGTGGNGGKELEVIFRGIAELCSIEIEEVVIPVEQGHNFQERMKQWLCEYHQATHDVT